MRIIEIKENHFEGKYASPQFHPITCANPAPWLITEMRITIDKLWIRGSGSMWFRADQCHIGTMEELSQLIYEKSQTY